jgi:hypothetical protein
MLHLTKLFSDRRKQVNLFHIAIIAPLLGYIAYLGINGHPIDKNIYYFLVVMALVIVIYHGYRLTQTDESKDESKEIKDKLAKRQRQRPNESSEDSD